MENIDQITMKYDQGLWFDKNKNVPVTLGNQFQELTIVLKCSYLNLYFTPTFCTHSTRMYTLSIKSPSVTAPKNFKKTMFNHWTTGPSSLASIPRWWNDGDNKDNDKHLSVASQALWSECWSPWNPYVEALICCDGVRRQGFRRCSGHEDLIYGSLMNGISVLIKETPGSSPRPSTLQAVSSLQPRRGASPEPSHTGPLILDFQSPNLWVVRSCCLEATQSAVFCHSSLN